MAEHNHHFYLFLILSFVAISNSFNVANTHLRPTFAKISDTRLTQSVSHIEGAPPSKLHELSLFHKLGSTWKTSVEDLRKSPLKFLSIPISAAIIGYVTNWVGVKMLFYPIDWTGVSILRWHEQPFGLFGWQGVVPAKRRIMASKLVDVSISKLITVGEIFSRLDPSQLATHLQPSVSNNVFGGFVPGSILHLFLKRTGKHMIRNIERVVDIKNIVVGGLTSDPAVLGNFFQSVVTKELKFLVDSGFGFGFLLGLIQMLQWMIFPANWTLVVGERRKTTKKFKCTISCARC